MTTFDCPECDHESSHWGKWTAVFTVFVHFFWVHPDLAAAWGDPRQPENPPSPEEYNNDGGAQ